MKQSNHLFFQIGNVHSPNLILLTGRKHNCTINILSVKWKLSNSNWGYPTNTPVHINSTPHHPSPDYFYIFLIYRSNIEENNWKLVSKLAKQAGGSCSQGTFGPVWSLLRTTAERLASLHLQMVHKVGDLVKEVSKYAEDLHRKHKTVRIMTIKI